MAKPEIRKKSGRFVKGQSGNPGGRPKGSSLDWCREFCEKEGKEKLMQLARHGEEKVSLQALTLMFAYGYGKPTEHHEHSGTLTLENLLAESL